MATIVTRAGKGSALTWTEGDSNFTNLNTDKLENVVDDTTPQLGGDLDLNTRKIVTTSNGAITLAPNGSGSIILNEAGTGAVVSRRTATTGTISNAIVLQRNYTADVLANMDGHASAIAFGVRDSATASSTFARVGGEYATTGDHAVIFEMSGNNFTTATRIAMLAAGSLILGTPATSTAQTITTIDTQDLVLNTNFGTDSGSITITDGANGDITISPNGSGDLHVITDALRIGDLNTEARISTYGTGNLVLTTNEGNDPDPTITIGNGANANITLTPSGTGKSSTTNLTYNEAVYTSGSTTGTITPDCANGPVQSITLTGSITFSAFSNPVSGQTLTLIITQPASGGPYTLTSTMKFAGGSKTLSTAANAIDIVTVSYIGTTYYASLAKAFA